jgi:hypothetical protein
MLPQWLHSAVMDMWAGGVTIHPYQIVAIGVYLVYLKHGINFSSHFSFPRLGLPYIFLRGVISHRIINRVLLVLEHNTYINHQTIKFIYQILLLNFFINVNFVTRVSLNL